MTYQTGPRATLSPRHIAMADAYAEKAADQVFDDTLVMQLAWATDKTPDENQPKVNTILKAMAVPTPILSRESSDLVQYPLLYGTSTNSMSFDGMDELRTNMDEGIAKSWMEWAFATDYCALPWTETIRNAGAQRLLDRQAIQVRRMYSSLGEKLEQDIIVGTQGDTVIGSQNKIQSMSALISATPTSGTRQNVSSSTYTWWRSQYDTCATFATTGLDKLDSLLNTCSSRAGLRGPNLHLTTYSIWRSYCKQAEGIHRVTGDINSVDLGIGMAYYKNRPVLHYTLVPTTYWWMLDMSALRFYVHSDADFVDRHPVSPNNQEIALQTRVNAALAWGSVEQRHHGLLAVAG